MQKLNILILVLFSIACSKEIQPQISIEKGKSYVTNRTINYNDLKVDLVIDKPENNEVDVLMVFHGTVLYDNKILEAANNSLDAFKRILNKPDMMIVSVAYPEENLLMGDNLAFCEAAFLWLKNKSEQELGIKVKKIFLAGHSQGGYLVTRLNTLYQTNGVIANGPGPLNLVYRCQLEEQGKIQSGITCTLLKNNYGLTSENSEAYYKRSLLNFTDDFKSDILFIQGMDDTNIQMYSWPTFKKQVIECKNCKNVEILELTNWGHTALFESEEAKTEFNKFIEKH
jgi:poly(3-hydroxybutyrate) depolymerase